MLKHLVLPNGIMIGAEVVAFSSLNHNQYSAVIEYYENELDVVLEDTDLFAVGSMLVDQLIAATYAVYTAEEMDFNTYHSDMYARDIFDMYPEEWPVILGAPTECIMDGWHRFHAYIDKGFAEIPFVYPINIGQLSGHI